jgi:hypothetical protein
VRLTTALWLLLDCGLAAMTIAIVLWPTGGTSAATYATPALVAVGLICVARHDREQGR